jgi:hypothetical protein
MTPTGQLGWYAPIYVPLTSPLMVATASMPAPLLMVAIILQPPSMRATAVMLPPSLSVSDVVLAPLSQAVAAMLTPTVTIDTPVAAARMSAVASMLAPALSSSVGIAPPPMSAVAQFVPPVIGVGVVNIVSSPTMGATAVMPAPVVSSAVTLTPPVMRANAAMLAPSVGFGAGVVAPLLGAVAQMLAPTVTIGVVTIKGVTGSLAATVAIPTHVPGDLIIIWASNGASATSPTKPAASGTVPAWNDIDATATGTGGACVGRTAYFVAQTNNHTSGAWANTNGMNAIVLSGQSAANPIGGHGNQLGSNATAMASPALTMVNTDGSSPVIYLFSMAGAVAYNAPPAGTTQQYSATGGTCCDTATGVTSGASISQTTPARTTKPAYAAAAIEVRLY